MDRILIDNSLEYDTLNIDKDSYIVINDDVQAKKIQINIINCKATIIDSSKIENKNLNIVDSEVSVVEIINSLVGNRYLNIKNEKSNIEYNAIDLLDCDVNYFINGDNVSETSQTKINLASICYKNKNKDYKIKTFNFSPNTVNEITCFGIVKDKSMLNYDVNSFIKKGAKKSIVRQNSNILLFDDESLGKNNPILEIEENDVKASHGSSIGKIDDDTMFYLCSRGLSKNEATNLICLGKLEYLINKIDDESIKENVIKKFKERVS